MAEAKKDILYKVQKGNRPKIEEVISACLDGHLHDIAMDFAVWMRENNLTFKLYTSNTRSHTVGYGDMALCRTFIQSEEEMKDNHWLKWDGSQYFGITVFLRDIGSYNNAVAAVELNDFIWNNIKHCGQCNSKCTGERTVTIFGKELSVCRLQSVV